MNTLKHFLSSNWFLCSAGFLFGYYVLPLLLHRLLKPPSLAEEAIAALNEIEDRMLGPSNQEKLIRRALKRLRQLEKQQ
jgi:hypothetical protein